MNRERRPRGTGTFVAAVVVASALVAPEATARPAEADVSQPSGERHTITLVTGDRVDLYSSDDGQHNAVFTAAPGREHVGYTTRTVDGRFHLVPGDAAALIDADRLDAALFDLTGLVAAGYDDVGSPLLPLIVQYDPDAAGVQSTALPPGVTERFVLESINARAVWQPRDRAAAFWPSVAATAAVRKVWLSRRFQAVLDRSVPQVGALSAWAGGFDGTGVKVAVVDSGIDTAHPDLDDGKVVAAANFSTDPDAADRNGHGTHVASTVAGTGEASAVVRKGVAPGAKLLNAKALNARGLGSDAAVIEALEWAAAQGADVVNMSLGSLDPARGPDPLTMAVDAVSRTSGTLVVVAAGNQGERGTSTITSPGWADEALTVGAVDREDAVADFSSRGPRLGDHAIKPDLVAPGVDIVAARAEGTRGGPVVDERYQQLSGTSMATPHVAGAAAILAQQHPTYTNSELKGALISTARTATGVGVHDQGGGRLDVARAFAQRVHAVPGTLDLGYLRWPHPTPVTRNVTYTNTTTSEVASRLSLDVSKEDGTAPPAGMFTLGSPQVTVPAGGTASVAVSVDPTAGPAGRYEGYLVGTAGDVTVHTSVGVYVEPEVYDVTVTAVPRDGELDEVSQVVLWSPGSGTAVRSVSADKSTVTFRLPPGTYIAAGFLIKTEAGPGRRFEEVTFVGDPRFEVSGDTALTLDGRTANEIVVDTELPAVTVAATLGVHRAAGGREMSFHQVAPYRVRAYAAPTETVTDGEFEFLSRWDLMAPSDEGGAPPSYEYDLLLPEKQRVPSSLAYTIDRSNTAIVDTFYRADVEGEAGSDIRMPRRPYEADFGEHPRTVPRPSHRTYFVSADDTQWQHAVQPTRSGAEEFLGPFTAYKPGEVIREEALGRPALPGTTPSMTPSERTGDTFTFNVSPLVDSGGHRRLLPDSGEAHRTGLWANGELLDEGPVPPHRGWPMTVLPDPAVYRLLYTSEQSAPWAPYSTRIRTEWTIPSGRPADGTTDRVPLMRLDYRPALDDHNRAPGGAFGFPLHVGHVPGVHGAPVATVQGWASSDDGSTWEPMSLLDLGDGDYVARLRHPSSGAVSLRVVAADTAGNGIDQTVIRAYGVSGP
ncbi:S8 family serine peptidase [Saccharothrix violaceirubra]|uniref:Subtilisin family serine protease n=1 Tax=Saccharothrix violaceirubra TaxID=413306 RepID=A0A7W7WVL0_9PSEU|nr:S8 family peptidase [Saccharothrix violaceirubra]MBB4965449.1 subtilisin family serine protease [Saccharothrix violaceirubra]